MYDLLSYDSRVFVALYHDRLQLNSVNTDVTLLLQSENSVNPSYVEAFKVGANQINRRLVVNAGELCDGVTKIEFDDNGRLQCTGCDCSGLNTKVAQRLLVSKVHLVPRGTYQHRAWACNDDQNKVRGNI